MLNVPKSILRQEKIYIVIKKKINISLVRVKKKIIIIHNEKLLNGYIYLYQFHDDGVIRNKNAETRKKMNFIHI